MRLLITCKICDRLLYEPYSLSCGHTYCYSCLCTWLVNNKKKTCPDCRAVATQQPTPSYVIREMTLIFLNRAELLPDGETTEQHAQWAKEEAEIVQKDKADANPRNGGLFKGCFRHGRLRLQAIHDPGDGVDRCPECHWELEDGVCNSCGLDVDGGSNYGFSDYDGESFMTDDELDHELDMHDAEVDAGYAHYPADDYLESDDFIDYDENPLDSDRAVPADLDELFGMADGAAMLRNPRTLATRRRHQHPIEIDSQSSEEDSDEEDSDEDDTEMQGFIDDGEEAVGGASASSDRATESAPQRRRVRHVVLSDDEGAVTSTVVDSEDGDSDDEGPVAAGSQRAKRSHVRRRQHPIAISSDEDSSEEGDVDEEEPNFDAGGFSPLQSQQSEDELDTHDDDGDSDGPSSVHRTDDIGSYDEEHYYDDNDNDSGGGSTTGASTMRTPFHLPRPNAHSLTGTADRPLSTPTSRHQAPGTASHRLQTLGLHSKRHTSVRSNQQTQSHAGSDRRGVQQRYPADDARPARQNAFANFMRRADRAEPGRSRQAEPRPRRADTAFAGLPEHPFTLSNTLASINNTHHASGYTASTSPSDSSRSSGGVGVQRFDRSAVSSAGVARSMPPHAQSGESSNSSSSQTLGATSRRTSDISIQADRVDSIGRRQGDGRQHHRSANARSRRKRAISISSVSSSMDGPHVYDY